MVSNIELSSWTFNDGVPIHEELGCVETSKIRAVCDQQSRTRWTSIASRHRLYQFIALSDEGAQREMRQKALSLISMDSEPPPAHSYQSAASTSSRTVFTTLVNPTARNEDDLMLHASGSRTESTKRLVLSHITNVLVKDPLFRCSTGSEASMNL
jgi:hypothetical protein